MVNISGMNPGDNLGSIVLPLGEGRQYILRDTYIREWNLNIMNGIEAFPNFGLDKIIPIIQPPEINVDLSLTAGMIELIVGGKITESVRDKRVEACSVAELLFAIRMKIN